MKRFVEGLDRGQSTFFPETLDDFVEGDNAVRVIEAFVEALALDALGFGGVDPNTGEKMIAARELVRMALPRRVDTNSQLDYIAEVAGEIVKNKDQLRGYRITSQSVFLRHFTCELEALNAVEVAAS